LALLQEKVGFVALMAVQALSAEPGQATSSTIEYAVR
jgi:hypothetical protein